MKDLFEKIKKDLKKGIEEGGRLLGPDDECQKINK